MTILVIAEHDNKVLAPATLNTVAAAAKIGGDIHVLVAGQGAGPVAEAAAKIAGVSKVLNADNAAYAHQLPENVAPLVTELGKGYSHILAAATSNGKNILPRVAAALDVDQISEIIAVESADTFKRPIYAGNAIATVQSSAAVKVITVRATGFDPVAAEGGFAAVEAVSAGGDAGNRLRTVCVYLSPVAAGGGMMSGSGPSAGRVSYVPLGQLADIGLTAEQARKEATRPFWQLLR